MTLNQAQSQETNSSVHLKNKHLNVLAYLVNIEACEELYHGHIYAISVYAYLRG